MPPEVRSGTSVRRPGGDNNITANNAEDREFTGDDASLNLSEPLHPLLTKALSRSQMSSVTVLWLEKLGVGRGLATVADQVGVIADLVRGYIRDGAGGLSLLWQETAGADGLLKEFL
jgi:hypothetical protein